MRTRATGPIPPKRPYKVSFDHAYIRRVKYLEVLFRQVVVKVIDAQASPAKSDEFFFFFFFPSVVQLTVGRHPAIRGRGHVWIDHCGDVYGLNK